MIAETSIGTKPNHSIFSEMCCCRIKSDINSDVMIKITILLSKIVRKAAREFAGSVADATLGKHSIVKNTHPPLPALNPN